MDDPRLVGPRERVRELRREGQGLARGEGSRVQHLAQRPSLDELHHEEGTVARLADLVDRDDVGVIERGGGAGLVLEAREARRIRAQRDGQRLDRDVPLEARVARAPDDAHPAGAERREQLVGAQPGSSRERHVAPNVTVRIGSGPSAAYGSVRGGFR